MNSLTEAMRLHRDGKLAEAKQAYLELNKLEPKNCECLQALAVTCSQRHEYPEAISYLKTALAVEPDNASLFNMMGNAYAQLKKYEEARSHYLSALKIKPNYAEVHNNLANMWLRLGQADIAAEQYHLALQIKPDYVDAHYNAGLLAVRMGLYPKATKHFLCAIKYDLTHFRAHFQLANCYLLAGNFKDAQTHFEMVLMVEPQHIEALNNCGICQLQQQQEVAALEYFAKVLAINPVHGEARRNMASTFLHLNRFDEAICQYQEYLAGYPDDLDALFNLGVAYMSQGRLYLAKEQFESVLPKYPDNIPVLTNLAVCCVRLGRKALSRQYYQRILELDPTQEIAAFMLAAADSDPHTVTAPQEYVRTLFDNYASYYEKHVQEGLSYQVPSLLNYQLTCHLPAPARQFAVLDLGCGTGLSGHTVIKWARELVGIDLSDKMLKMAAEKGIYTSLIQGDIVEQMQRMESCFDLIVIADTLVYFGDLSNIFKEIVKHLNPGGFVAFTTEKTAARDFELRDSCRFAHSLDYLRDLSAQHGFQEKCADEISLRLHNDLPLAGNLIIWQRADAAKS